MSLPSVEVYESMGSHLCRSHYGILDMQVSAVGGHNMRLPICISCCFCYAFEAGN